MGGGLERLNVGDPSLTVGMAHMNDFGERPMQMQGHKGYLLLEPI